MNRLQKKCLAASGFVHAFLVLLIITSTAFFVPQEKKIEMETLKVVPTKLIDAAFSGGGGDPTAPKTDAQEQGRITPPPEPPPKPKPPKPKPPEPKPKPEPKKTEPKKAEPVKKPTPPPKELPPPKIELKRVTRNPQEEEDARLRAEARARDLANRKTASQIEKLRANLRQGFQQGTVVKVHGPGGEAYANYAQFVKSVYEKAWDGEVRGDYDEDDGTATVSVNIARRGHVLSAKITKYSGNAVLDRSVQRALDKVKFVARFPEGATEDSRTFTINFNLKSKRQVG